MAIVECLYTKIFKWWNYLPEDVLAAKVGHFDEAVLHRVRVLTLDLCGQTVQKKISIQNPTSDVMLMLGETRPSYSGN